MLDPVRMPALDQELALGLLLLLAHARQRAIGLAIGALAASGVAGAERAHRVRLLPARDAGRRGARADAGAGIVRCG